MTAVRSEGRAIPKWAAASVGRLSRDRPAVVTPDAVFALAGEAAAWHLGYLPRRLDGRPAVWPPNGAELPHGLRSHVSLIRIDWPVEGPRQLGGRDLRWIARGVDVSLPDWDSYRNNHVPGPGAKLRELPT
jgi:hypothetical protein